MTLIIAIDPGPEQSAYCKYHTDTGMIPEYGILPTDEMVKYLRSTRRMLLVDHVAIEMIASYGMPVGAEVFNTCVQIGRMIEASRRDYSMVYRKDVKMALCNNMRAKDANIRQAIIDRYGGRAAAIGTKANPGPLYNAKRDVWSAIGVAIAWSEKS
jgi:hypothetical protein